ncbi:type IV toxin-antitoxin system AbiEi family antitoxin [Pedobacter frigoris]|uniref:type IV toxin-antitoxin system AbiEi family antitoxin n=1 Tax=Pedobacter frigoris TaxID=2571272 RepID=UPI002931BBBE|nr:type IV toxin-antitoxin system AbiEi family antitoxin [Pedobacter frigoris]
MDTQKIDNILDHLTDILPGNIEFKVLPAPNQFTFDAVCVSIPKIEKKFTAEYKAEPRLIHLPYFKARNHDSGPILVIANHISNPVKEELRKAKINYVDAAGNICIDDAPILIYTDGLKRKQLKETNKNRAFTKTGLKVVFAFLEDPQLMNLPYRVIADDLKVALDTVHNVINGLKEMGFIIRISDKKNKLINLKQLLDRWIQEYDVRLKPDLFIGNFRFVSKIALDSWKELKLNAPALQWGGEPAGALITNYLRPGELILYTSQTKLEVMKELKLLPDPKGNIKLYKKFWRDSEPEKQYVPEILAYADLINHGDSRNAETAQRIYEQHLQNRFD